MSINITTLQQKSLNDRLLTKADGRSMTPGIFN